MCLMMVCPVVERVLPLQFRGGFALGSSLDSGHRGRVESQPRRLRGLGPEQPGHCICFKPFSTISAPFQRVYTQTDICEFHDVDAQRRCVLFDLRMRTHWGI